MGDWRGRVDLWPKYLDFENMFKNLIFQLFKTKGLAKIEKFISARKGVKSAHDFFSEFFSYYVGNGACS